MVLMLEKRYLVTGPGKVCLVQVGTNKNTLID